MINTLETTFTSGFAPVNGLEMYYEIHGSGAPLILIHGALSGIGTSFGRVLPLLAETRQVIAIEMQAHGRTADIDRSLTIDQLAEDVAALIVYLGLGRADVFGYSIGAAVAMQVAIAHPVLVRKLILASVSYSVDGIHPGMLEGIELLQPEHLAGTPFQQEYASIAPIPENWRVLVEKIKRLDHETREWTREEVQSINSPTLLVIGDSDIVRPEHAVEMFRLLGGGVSGDNAGLPNSQLAVLPGTTHTSLVNHADWLASMIEAFLEKKDLAAY